MLLVTSRAKVVVGWVSEELKAVFTQRSFGGLGGSAFILDGVVLEIIAHE